LLPSEYVMMSCITCYVPEKNSSLAFAARSSQRLWRNRPFPGGPRHAENVWIEIITWGGKVPADRAGTNRGRIRGRSAPNSGADHVRMTHEPA
jgi:hypothetical protein